MQETASRYPSAFAGWLQGLSLASAPIPQLAIVGDTASPGFAALAEVAHRPFLPRLVMAGGKPADAAFPELLRGKPAIDGRATAYLCHGFVCRQPTTSPGELRDQLAEAR
jgi:uncharacterized protein YyaL (SSP411 family)